MGELMKNWWGAGLGCWRMPQTATELSKLSPDGWFIYIFLSLGTWITCRRVSTSPEYQVLQFASENFVKTRTILIVVIIITITIIIRVISSSWMLMLMRNPVAGRALLIARFGLNFFCSPGHTCSHILIQSKRLLNFWVFCFVNV